MESLNINSILQREIIIAEIKEILDSFETKCKSIHFKKGIYIYGSPGCGKTRFVTDLLHSLNYDIIKYDAGDVRNKTLIETITSNNISNRNVLQLMNGKIKKIVIVMDEIDGMNNGDKGGITSLIKLIRQKKTKKQKTENVTLNPIICIGNHCIDKKIKELMKVCNVFEFKTPTDAQIGTMLETIIPTLSQSPSLKSNILNYVQGDLLKLEFIADIYKKKPELLNENILSAIFMLKSYNYDAKKITHSLMNQPLDINEHAHFMDETDRTIVSLLYHENIIDVLDATQQAAPSKTADVGAFYVKVMDNICYSDYIDRVTFQNQIWVFNEMSSLIKTFYNNYMYHKTFPGFSGIFQPAEVRFTKVLTKYSTEYNNQLFIYNFCQELNMDKKDVEAFFQELRLFHGKTFYNHADKLGQVMELFQSLNISKLDVKRMYRYLDKNVKPVGAAAAKGGEDDDLEDELDYEEL